MALTYIISVTVCSIMTARFFSTDVTWFTYFTGAVVGLFISGFGLEIWNRTHTDQQMLILPRYEI